MWDGTSSPVGQEGSEPLYTNKGDLGVWRVRLNRGSGLCRLCGEAPVSGPHLVFDCWRAVPRRGWCYGGWGELNDKALWRYEYAVVEVVRYGDRVEDFFVFSD